MCEVHCIVIGTQPSREDLPLTNTAVGSEEPCAIMSRKSCINLETKSNITSTFKMSTTQESIDERPPSGNTCPSTLSELRRRIAYRLCDNSQHSKCCLNRAEKSRKKGKEYLNIDPERAFVAFAGAGYLLLVKLPMHPHYRLLLSDEQRRNMLHVRYFNPLDLLLLTRHSSTVRISCERLSS